MSNKNFKTSIGGQALMEGILMRGSSKQAIVCNTPNGFVDKVEDLKITKDKYKILGVPFIRGCFIFISSLVNGMQALTFSAEQLPEEQQTEPDKLDKWIADHFPEEKAKKLIIGLAVILGIVLAAFLFIVLPTTLVGFIKPIKTNYIARNLLEGLFKIIILLLYMMLCSKQSDIKRVFTYHGAEHKTIFCYEHGKELTVENVRPESRFHPRCGTSFLLVVVIVSILVNSIVVTPNTILRMVFHLLLLPVVVGISYEINRSCGLHDNWFTAAISAPGKWLQHITTNEPDDGMIETAIRAMKYVIPETEGEDAWGN